MKSHDKFQVIVVGAGHAGVEAALAAARMGMKTLLLTINLDTIGLMPCNPSVGGPGKGHIVCEVDALGGEMARNIDETMIHVRMLNTSKGPAVQALRAQADKKRYQNRLKHVLENHDNVQIRQSMVKKLLSHEKHIVGVEIETGEQFFSEAVVVTTGTFLNGLIHIGKNKFPAGRLGEFPATGLSENLKELGFNIGRLKTGTVARVNAKQIDFSRCMEQKSSSDPLTFSYFSPKRKLERSVSSWITHTTPETHEIIRRNFHKAPLFSGQIEGIGPRYCPSIEDKVNRFPDRESHHVFLEYEGLETNEVYMQGISTSLPIEVQKEFINTIPGLENVEIMRPGYAIEYDFVFPTQLKLSLESKILSGLFLAGQINGTSGYEEAAGQGILAGINAAASILGLNHLTIGRDEGYIGVMIDDIVTKDTYEPYRIFTSRAEYRLSMRIDNADTRLAGYGHKYGLLSDKQYQLVLENRKKIELVKEELKKFHVKRPKNETLMPLSGKSIYQALKSPGIKFDDFPDLNEEFKTAVEEDTKNRVEIEVKYEGYIEKQKRQIEEFKKTEEIKIPEDIIYGDVLSISTEARMKLNEVKPISVGQASRISGVSPADITVLIYYIRQVAKKR